MLSSPLSPPLSSGTKGLKLKKSSFAGTRQLGPGALSEDHTWRCLFTACLGLGIKESHYHLAAELVRKDLVVELDSLSPGSC